MFKTIQTLLGRGVLGGGLAGAGLMLAGVAGVSAAGMEGGPGGGRYSYGVDVGYAGSGGLSLGTAGLGDMESLEYRVQGGVRFVASESYSWSVGVDFSGLRFDLPAGVALPEELYGVALKFSNRWKLSERWTLSAVLSPGIYSDLEDVSGGDLNMPVLGLFEYRANESLLWYLGFQANLRREIPVLPAVGFRWEMSPEWALSVVYPSPRVEYRASDRWTLHAGVDFTRSAYRLAEDFGTRRGVAGLDDEEVNYSDWRVGLGMRVEVAKGFFWMLEGGWLVDRRFEVEAGNLLFNGDGAPFVQTGIRGRF